MYQVPSLFIERYRALLEGEFDEFMECLVRPARRGVRINTLKVLDVDSLLESVRGYGWDLTRVPWYRYGYWIDGECNITPGNTVEGFLGLLYGQDPSSMIPPLVMDLHPDESLKILDMCASPGSKTSMIAELVKNRGVVVANELKPSRIKPLVNNLRKLGVLNTVVINRNGIYLPRIFGKETFDRVLVDAPCSGEGLIRYNWNVLKGWNIAKVRHYSRIQKQLLMAGVSLLKPDGVLVYSTCTFAPEENEEVIDYVISKREDVIIEEITLDGLRFHRGIEEWNGRVYSDELRKTVRVFPHDNDSEGFFIAKLRKVV